MCLKELIQKLQPAIRVPTKLVARKECLVRCILDLDLEAFVPKKRTHVKPSLSVVSLRAAAEIWRRYHPMNDKDELKDLKGTLPYPVLWMHLKRLALKACGLCVVLSPSHRVYFEEPFHRPHLAPGDHPAAKDGKWREKVVVPGSYAKTVEDEDMQDDLRREKKYVRSAAYEQAMGRGGVPEEEVPTPLDDAALDCPDTATKAEWDAPWQFETFVRPVAILSENEGLEIIRDGDERLLWPLPEREGGLSERAFSGLVVAQTPAQLEEPATPLDALDPTQAAFAAMAIDWYSGRNAGTAAAATAGEESGYSSKPGTYFRAILLGTAGTGKTTTLKAILSELRHRGLQKFAVAAYTGVAANNIGCGARTLSDLFRLSKMNEASGELEPLAGDDLSLFKEELAGLELLIIDEISMVSRVVLAQIHARLQEWRVACEDRQLAQQPFGGVAVVLAGDFGQLPPIGVSPSLSLVYDGTHSGIREHKAANQGLRLLQLFDTVVRLRRVHRQPGACRYKESLIRLRDGAMTKEDHALWATHNLNDVDTCELTDEQRSYMEDKVPHLFAENAFAGVRNGHKAGAQARATGTTILRVASSDSSDAAAKQAHDQYGQLRRVVHLLRDAPVMLIANLRTRAGLVNGAVGYVKAAVLRDGARSAGSDLRYAVNSTDVRYVVVEFPTYNGPVFFPGHPKYVVIRPISIRHKRMKQWVRVQLPLALAWGLTIHKSQGLTFHSGVLVDFAHQPSYQPVEHMGLAFVAMSRTTAWSKQAFQNLPSLWEFRKMLQGNLFKWRSSFEKTMDMLHDATMQRYHGKPWLVEMDLEAHVQWSVQRLARQPTEAEVEDIRAMLSVRGVVPAPEYTDEPQPGPRGLRGGGGRKHKLGMKPHEAKRHKKVVGATEEHDEAPVDKLPESMFAERDESVVETDEHGRPPEVCTWLPPWHHLVDLPTVTATVPAPSWYNNADSGAISMPARVQENASCGLHAVNHLLACSSHPVVLQKDRFVECGLRAKVGDSPANLLDPRSGNYDVAILHANLMAWKLSVFPMTAADIEGTEDRASLLPGSRLQEPFREYVVETGSYKTVGYLLRVPQHGGHWITLLPGRVVTPASCGNTLLCDSIHRCPFVLTQTETESLLVACAIDSATGACHDRTGFVCFLVAEAKPRVQCEMLFEVPWADYATELARLCKEYGITGRSSSNYKVQGSSGKDFTLVFHEQPQLEPGAEKADFPLTVRTRHGSPDSLPAHAEMTDLGAGTLEGRLDTLEEAQLNAVLATSVLDVRSELPLAHEVPAPLPYSPVGSEGVGVGWRTGVRREGEGGGEGEEAKLRNARVA